MEIIPDKFYFVVGQTPQALREAAASGLVLHVDSETLYEPFFADFGPLNAAHTYRFCVRANELLQVRLHCTSSHCGKAAKPPGACLLQRCLEVSIALC